MAKNPVTTKVVDEIIRVAATGLTVGAGLTVPNLLIALDKPLRKLYYKLDEREREREVKRIIYNMKERGYLVGEYEHGMQLTEKAKKRYRQADMNDLTVAQQSVWDKSWRIIIYDIPESSASARRAIQSKLHEYGCFHLQKSVLITPFPCEADIAKIAAYYGVESYVTLFESHYIINQQLLIGRFRKKYPDTKF